MGGRRVRTKREGEEVDKNHFLWERFRKMAEQVNILQGAPTDFKQSNQANSFILNWNDLKHFIVVEIRNAKVT